MNKLFKILEFSIIFFIISGIINIILLAIFNYHHTQLILKIFKWNIVLFIVALILYLFLNKIYNLKHK